MNAAPQSSSAVPLSAALRSFAAQWQTRTADPLSAVRERAMQRFLELGLPTSRDETWRYTNLRTLAAQSFVDAPRRPRGGTLPHPAPSLLGDSGGAAPLLMINGYPSLPGAGGAIEGMEIHSLRELARVDPG